MIINISQSSKKRKKSLISRFIWDCTAGLLDPFWAETHSGVIIWYPAGATRCFSTAGIHWLNTRTIILIVTAASCPGAVPGELESLKILKHGTNRQSSQFYLHAKVISWLFSICLDHTRWLIKLQIPNISPMQALGGTGGWRSIWDGGIRVFPLSVSGSV